MEVVVAFLRQVATTPTIFLFEDADEMDESSVTIVAEMAEQLDDRPWVLLVTRSRGPGGLQPVPEPPFVAVELPPLDEKESLALLEAWTRDSPVSDTLLRAIAEKAGGNPLFMEALLDVARERGSVADLPDSVGLWSRARSTGSPLGTARCSASRRCSATSSPSRRSAPSSAARGGPWTRTTCAASTPSSSRRARTPCGGGSPTRSSGTRRTTACRSGCAAACTSRRARCSNDRSRTAPRSPSSWRPTSSRRATCPAPGCTPAWPANRSRAVYSYAAALDQYQRAAYAAARVDGVPPREIADILEAQGDVADLAGLSRESIAAYRRAREFVRDDPLALAALMTKEVALHQRVGQLTTALRIIAHARRLARDDSRTRLPGPLPAHRPAGVRQPRAGQARRRPALERPGRRRGAAQRGHGGRRRSPTTSGTSP